MAAPSYVNASTGSTDAGGAWSATCHAPGAAGRIIIAQILQDGTTNNAVTFTSATNIEALDGTDNAWTQISGPLVNGTWAVGGSEEALQFIFIGRSLSTSAPTMGGGNSTSEDLYWRFYEFSDVSTGTTLATVIEGAINYLAAGAGSASWGQQASNTRYAQSFVATGPFCSGVKIPLKKTGGPTDTITVALQADSGGVPSGTDLATANLDGSLLTSSFVEREFLWTSTALTLGNTYWIVCRRSGAVDASNYYGWADSATAYAGGSGAAYNPTTWTTGFGDAAFRVYEPGGAFNTAATDGTITDAGVTTFGPDRLALNFVGINDDNAINVFTGETGGDWTLAVAGYAESSGTDGAIGLQNALVNPTGDFQTFFQSTAAASLANSNSNARLAQSIVPAAPLTVSYFSVALRRQGSPSDNLIIELQSDNSGEPSGTVLATIADAPMSSFTTASTGAIYHFETNFSVSASTTYWIVFRRSGAVNASNYLFVPTNSGNPYAGGTHKVYDSTFTTWTESVGFDMAFQLWADVDYDTATIDGGTATNADSGDAWGVVGFALIGTSVSEVIPAAPTTRQPHYPAIVFQDPAIV